MTTSRTKQPEQTLSQQIAAIIGADHPDLERLCVRILRGQRPAFDAAAARALLKAGMHTSVVMDGGLDAAWNLHRHANLGAEVSAELVVTTVNMFGLSPTYLSAIPRYVAIVHNAHAGTE